MRRQVVITGIGTVSPLGLNTQETWQNAIRGQSGVGKITHFDANTFPVQIAAEVKIPESEKYFSQFIPAKELRRFGRFCHLTFAAGFEAYKQAGLSDFKSTLNAERIGTNIGVGMGGLPEIEAVHREYLQKGPKRISPFFIPQAIPNMASGQLSILLGLKGPNLCNVTACASSAHSIGESFRAIQDDRADIMFAGGAEAVICPLGIGGFASMKALSTRNDAPEKASRPFDVNRDGFVMGEGACVLVLEEKNHAKRRGAKILAELVGYGLSGDAYHMTAPSPEGEGGGRAMKLAFDMAGVDPKDTGYINAHGTSTPAGDIEEIKAIAKLYGSFTKQTHVSSTKSMTGHLLGAAGALEAALSVLALQDGVIPPTINLDTLDPECKETGLDFTPHKAIQKNITHALSNSFGFGGTNASLLFGKS